LSHQPAEHFGTFGVAQIHGHTAFVAVHEMNSSASSMSSIILQVE
jgi:hypothetical protein